MLTAEMKQNVLLLIAGDTKKTHVAVQVAVRIINLETYVRPSGDLHITESSAPAGGSPLAGGSESLS